MDSCGTIQQLLETFSSSYCTIGSHQILKKKIKNCFHLQKTPQCTWGGGKKKKFSPIFVCDVEFWVMVSVSVSSDHMLICPQERNQTPTLTLMNSQMWKSFSNHLLSFSEVSMFVNYHLYSDTGSASKLKCLNVLYNYIKYELRPYRATLTLAPLHPFSI